MFGWNFEHRSDRIKLFLSILVVFLVVGFLVSAIFSSLAADTQQKVVNEENSETESTEQVSISSVQAENQTEENVTNNYDQTEKFTKEQLEETEAIATEFAKAYHSYNSDDPMSYIENSKEYTTAALYEKMKRTQRRETLERSYLRAIDAQVTPVVNKSSEVIRWNVIVTGEARSVDGTISKTEDWYLVGLRQVDGEWKVEDVRTNVPN